MSAPADTTAALQARIAILQEGLVAAWELITDTVPTSPTGLRSWYMENLADEVDEIETRRPGISAENKVRATPLTTITVYGAPTPQGSKTRNKFGGVRDDNEATLKPWREAVRSTACDTIGPSWVPLQGPLVVEVTFTLKKPVSAPKTRRTRPTGQRSGDLDKLQRSVFDALTDAGVWGDDAQVVHVRASKDYPGQLPGSLNKPGALIRVWAAAESVTG